MATLITHNQRNEPEVAARAERWTPFLWAMLCLCVATSAIVVKQSRVRPQPMVAGVRVAMERPSEPISGTDWDGHALLGGGDPEGEHEEFVGPPAPSVPEADYQGFIPDPTLRWFNARPVRPARTIWMTVTAYSPDPQSCGNSADGITATLHSVTTNAHRLVAADPKVLPYGSMLTVPGYGMLKAGEATEPAIVPVLDCGSKIKGQRLDVLYPTHAEAMKWGVQLLPVTVWEYVDGLAVVDVRVER